MGFADLMALAGFVNARLRIVLANVAGAGLTRLANIVLTLATLPIALHALHPRGYAVFSMANSLSLLVAYADFGLGLAIVNVVAAQARPERARRVVSLVWFVLLGVGSIGVLVCAAAALLVPSAHAPEASAVILAMACMFAALPTGLVPRLLFARQCAVQANGWGTLGRVASLVAVWSVARSSHPGLPEMLFAALGGPLVTGWVAAGVVFGFGAGRDLRPRRASLDRRLLKPYVRRGLSFMLMALQPYAEGGVDNFLIGALASVALVPAYDINARVFAYVPALISIATMPLWPAIANARATRDLAWARRMRWMAYAATVVLTTAAAATLYLASGWLVQHWVGRAMPVTGTLLAGLALSSIVASASMVQSVVFNGYGRVRLQARLAFVYIPAVLLVKAVAVALFGVSAMVWSLVLIAAARIVAAEFLMGGRKQDGPV